MKYTKKLTALVMVGALCLSNVGIQSFAAENNTIKENTSKFELAVKRNVWGLGQSYEGHQGKVTITNKETITLNDWILEFDYDGEIKSVSNATLVSRTGNHYVVKAAHWFKTIRPGMSVTFEFQGKNTGNDADFNNVTLSTIEKPVKVTVLKSWALGATFAKNDMVLYNGQTYKCIQGHTAHAFNWTPNLTPALWGKVKASQSNGMNVLIQKY